MTLRHLCITGLAAVGLVACGEPAAEPAKAAPAATAGAATAASRASVDAVTLVGEGLRVSSAPAVIAFGAPRAEVEAALATALGATPTASENPDCPTGATQDLTWGDALSIVTRDGAFIGWTAGATGPQTAAGVRAGMTRAEVLAKGATEETDSQFSVTPIAVDGVSGFLNEAGTAVDNLYAGDVCIAS